MRLRYIGLCLSMIFALSFPLFANEPSQLALYPAHIEVRLGNVGDSFYRVMMDDEEQPYLPIESSITYLLEMHGNCVHKRCEIHLPQDVARETPAFIIDLSRHVCYRSNSTQQPIQILFYEEEWLIHWRSLNDCLPVKARWYIEDYQLIIDKGYKSPSELEEEIQKLKRDSRDRAKRLEQLTRQPSVRPLSTLGFSTRLSATASYESDNKEGGHLLSDSLLSTENWIGQMSVDSREDHPVAYYNITIAQPDNHNRVELGHVLLDGGLYSNPVILENGFHYSNHKTVPKFGNLQLERTTQPNINIDLLVNGVYQSSYRSDDFGRFVVEESNIAPGDTLTFRYYLAKGVWQQEEVIIAGLDGGFLPKGQWGIDLIADFEKAKVGAGILEYGIDDYLTFGSTALIADHDTLLAFQTRYLPRHWLAMHVGWIPELQRFPIELDMQFGRTQSLSLELNKTVNFTRNSELYDALKYSFSGPYYNAYLDLRREDDKYQISPQLSAKVARNLFLRVESNYTRDQIENIDDFLHTIELAKNGFSDTSWRVKGAWDKSGSLEQTEASLRNICTDCWINYGQYFEEVMSNLSASYTNNDVELSATLEARVNSNFKIKLFGNHEHYGIELTTEAGIRSHFDDNIAEILDWSKYSYAKLVGTVVDQQGNVIPNVNLRVLDQFAMSDENGEFVFHQVPAHDNLSIHVDESALDLNLTTQHNPILVNTRQAGVTQISVVLIASFGIDGVIEGPLEDHSYLHFKHIANDMEFSSKIEKDGFYMVEGLTSGLYLITLENGQQKRMMQAHLDNEFWISELNYQVSDFH
ncbi:carboxypeptidase-like regulatory domain-containing protein [Vibrio jasicida]|uniref:carboxypeptidase-like regulatory domain-containing protein n=1 Tax=Vibrio jasicida TaxID=766224 RepID=UPI004067FC76